MRKATPITVRGVTYPSQMEAALELEISQAAVSEAYRSNNLSNLALHGAPDPIPTTIRGITYLSQNAAAKAHGVTSRTIQLAVQRGTLDNVGLTKAKRQQP